MRIHTASAGRAAKGPRHCTLVTWSPWPAASPKVLLYHFDGADDLLGQAVARLRDRRIARGLAAAEGAAPQTLAVRVRAASPILAGEESWVHDQAIGQMMYEPARYGEFGRGSTRWCVPALLSICPASWSEQHEREVAGMILAARGGVS